LIRVVLCDDHAVLRRGIRDTLIEAADICVTAEAAGYAELREHLRTAECDVLLLDLNMPGRNGLEVLSSVRETYPHIKVLIVSMYPEDQYALRFRAASFLLRKWHRCLPTALRSRPPSFHTQPCPSANFRRLSRLLLAGDCPRSQKS
jgi:DNA-binding NarL/FixJ family response regulator